MRVGGIHSAFEVVLKGMLFTVGVVEMVVQEVS